MRVVAYLALAVGLFTTSVAGAAPKPFNCPMVTSPTGGRAYLDVTSADIASGPKFVTGVVRVGSTTTSNDPLAILGVKWRLAFQVNNLNYLFELSRNWQGKDTASSNLAGEAGPVPTVKIDAKSITWTVPRKDFKVLVNPGKVFQGLTASTTWNGGSQDSASAVIKYVDRAKACIVSG